MTEHKDLAGTAVACVGLKDRTIIVEDAGRSGTSSADLLEKIAEATEATLRKVERASPEGGNGTESSTRPPLQRAGGRGSDTNNLVQLGVRLLSESLARTAAVARRSADEAINAAVKALELSRNLAALDAEARVERDKKERKRRGFDSEDDEPVAARDAEEVHEKRTHGAKEDAAADAGQANGQARTPRERPTSAASNTTPRDQVKNVAKRVKERHVALRVKNLMFVATLNEEVLRSQARLRSVLQRSEGALLPEVSVVQKRQLFDLVAQLLDFALAESNRLAAAASAQPPRVFERSLGFALALDHGSEVAMPVDSRTQALKLAALVDSDLLCQVINGPFKRRLLAVAAKRRGSAESGCPSYARSRSNGHFNTQVPVKSWEDAAHSCCTKITEGIQKVVSNVDCDSNAHQGS